ncbi:MAG: hypothetical protein JSW63_06710 [Ignavibacterium sp.]|nr:MAG: hypothetical protein JSW63_06710 [Ignavibacterium sp.]
MCRKFLYTLLILFAFTPFGISQSVVDQKVIDAEFARAVEMYDAKRYNSALFRFEKIITGYDLNSKTSAASFFKIKILIDTGEYGDANYFCSQYIESYPVSKYTDEVRVLLIKTLLEEFEYQSAFEETLILIDQTSSILYRIEAKYFGENIADKYLDTDDLQHYLAYFTS